MQYFHLAIICSLYLVILQPDYYGGFNSDGYFVTARIPTSYHSCTFLKQEGREGRLPGCLVMDDKIDEQCSQGRTGMYKVVVGV